MIKTIEKTVKLKLIPLTRNDRLDIIPSKRLHINVERVNQKRYT